LRYRAKTLCEKKILKRAASSRLPLLRGKWIYGFEAAAGS
jgi:hypothetical protein